MTSKEDFVSRFMALMDVPLAEEPAGIRANLPMIHSCWRVAPRDEANLLRCRNVQFDYNLCVFNRMQKLEMRKINQRPYLKKSMKE